LFCQNMAMAMVRWRVLTTCARMTMTSIVCFGLQATYKFISNLKDRPNSVAAVLYFLDLSVVRDSLHSNKTRLVPSAIALPLIKAHHPCTLPLPCSIPAHYSQALINTSMPFSRYIPPTLPPPAPDAPDANHIAAAVAPTATAPFQLFAQVSVVV